MSDEEEQRPINSAEDDVSLPKSTCHKLIQELLPANYVCAKDAKDLMTECAKEFVLAIASEANEICEKDGKKTLMPEHILAALKSLGFDSFIDQVQDTNADNKVAVVAERTKKASKKVGNSGLSQEELLKLQEEMFTASRARFDAGPEVPVPEIAE